MKYVGEVVREQEIIFGSEDKVNVIGIVIWGIVDRKDFLKVFKVNMFSFKGYKFLIIFDL